MLSPLVRANWLALLLPLALVAGALGSQYIGGLFPCEMCYWQRWPHYAAIALAAIAFTAPDRWRWWLVLAAGLAIMISGAIGVYHAGVEYHWWAGPRCAVPGGSLADILQAPIIACDVPQWTLGPISMAGFNAIFSLLGGGGVLVLLAKATKRRGS